MAAGVAALGEVLTSTVLDELNRRGDRLRSELNEITTAGDTCIRFSGLGSLLGLHTTRQSISSIDDLADCDDRIKELVFLDLLELGYYIARRGFIALMLTIGDDELDGFKTALTNIIRKRGELLR